MINCFTGYRQRGVIFRCNCRFVWYVFILNIKIYIISKESKGMKCYVKCPSSPKLIDNYLADRKTLFPELDFLHNNILPRNVKFKH